MKEEMLERAERKKNRNAVFKSAYEWYIEIAGFI